MDEKYIKDFAEFLNISEKEAEEAAKEIYEKISFLVSDPSSFVDLVNKILRNFIKDSETADTKFGSDRKDYILGRINFLDLLLNKQLTSNQLALNILENKKGQIKEQHDFWKKELTRLPQGSNRLRKLDAEFKENEIERILSSVRRSLKLLLAYDLGTRLKEIKEEYTSALYMFQNIKEEISSTSVVEIRKDIISTGKELNKKTTTDDIKLIDNIWLDNNSVDDRNTSYDASDNQESYKVEYNASYFSETSYNFLNYLIDKYVGREQINKGARGVKRKLSYTWHFMTYLKNQEGFVFTMTKDKFKEIIWFVYGIELKNMDKKRSYDSIHFPSLKQHFKDFKKK